MNDTTIGRYRSTPLHAAEADSQSPETSPKNNALQEDAEMQPHAAANEAEAEQPGLPAAAEYTISVEQVRDHLRQKGLSKSKDTIQRWCRAGDFDWRKMGLLNRLFTTEVSLQALEEKLLPDMIADQTGTAQPHEAAAEPASSGMQGNALDGSGQHSVMQPQSGVDAGVPTTVQSDAGARAAAQSGT